MQMMSIPPKMLSEASENKIQITETMSKLTKMGVKTSKNNIKTSKSSVKTSENGVKTTEKSPLPISQLALYLPADQRCLVFIWQP